MDKHNLFYPQSEFASALETALIEIPEDVARSSIYRRFLSWPIPWRDFNYALPDLNEAVDKSLGTLEPVFAFLRYHVYAHARRSSHAIEYESRQNDIYQPLYVYWRVTRAGIVFQQSLQPEIAVDELSVELTVRYVADAIDFAGQFYQALNLTDEIAFEIAIAGGRGRRVVAGQRQVGELPGHDLVYPGRYTARQLVEGRVDIALRAARDLLFQSDVTTLPSEALEQFIADQVTANDRRREVRV